MGKESADPLYTMSGYPEETRMWLSRWLEEVWQSRGPASLLMLPLSWLYCGLMTVRRLLYRLRIKSSGKASVPVVVAHYWR